MCKSANIGKTNQLEKIEKCSSIGVRSSPFHPKLVVEAPGRHGVAGRQMTAQVFCPIGLAAGQV